MKTFVYKNSIFGYQSDPIVEWEYEAYYEEEKPVIEQNNFEFAPSNWHEVKTETIASVFYPETWDKQAVLEVL